MSNDIKTRLAKEILDFKWPVPTTDVMRGWNLALDSLVEYKLTNDIEKVVLCKDCKYWSPNTGLPLCLATKELSTMLFNKGLAYCSCGVRKDD